MKTPAIEASTPVGQIARQYPEAAGVFETLDIEYACKGGRPLRDAATAAGVSPDDALAAVRRVMDAGQPASEGTLAELIDGIITEHHRFEEAHFRDMPGTLQRLGDSPVAGRVRRLLDAIHATMATHMLREERDLFPRLEELDLHPHRVRAGSISNPLLIEFVEHDAVHEWLLKIRELVHRLRFAGGVDTAVLDAIDEFDRRVHRHLHLENNVLIPKVIDLENRLRSLRRETAAPTH